jgi:hypothetical protein
VESTPFCLKQRYRAAEAQDMAAEAQNMLSENTHPLDICLILRAHGEQRWLISEVVPTVRQLECDDAIAEDQVGAALAYLEVLWLDACKRAAETDAAREQLERDNALGDPVLYEKARRYHAAVRRLRAAVAQRVTALTGRNHRAPRWPILARYVSP